MNERPPWVELHELLIDRVCTLCYQRSVEYPTTRPSELPYFSRAQGEVVVSWLAVNRLSIADIETRCKEAIAAEMGRRTPFSTVRGPLWGGLKPDCRTETQKPDLDPEQLKDRLVVLCAGRGFYCRPWGSGQYLLHPDGQDGTVAGAFLCRDAAEALTVARRWDAEKRKLFEKAMAGDLAERTGVEPAPPCTAETKKTRKNADVCRVHGPECPGWGIECRPTVEGKPSAT